MALVDTFETTLIEARAELRACQSQRLPSDDRIIASHIDSVEGRLSALIEVLQANREIKS